MSTLPAIDPTQPARLIPVTIPKPWGQEIWYTGMEARGESQVLAGGKPTPLSDYLASDPARLCKQTGVLLLKVLDPRPQPVLGDLYFEVHEQKQEVYVVTHIDPAAWPDGVGGIRLGMSQSKRRQYADEQSFRADYLRAVQGYEQIRRQIDERRADITGAEEERARQHMDSFTELRELHVGDVVRVPTWTPHSLLHGVRVVEFQTDTYERFIISFAQRVQTQDHWDSAHAIPRMHLDPPPPATSEAVRTGVERIARFDDFNVWRIDLGAAAPLTLPSRIPYALCMCIAGNVRVGNVMLEPEQACFVPFAALSDTSLSGNGAALLAAPDL